VDWVPAFQAGDHAGGRHLDPADPVKPRDRVSFILGDDGVGIERAASGLDAIAGSVKPRKRPEDFKEAQGALEEK